MTADDEYAQVARDMDSMGWTDDHATVLELLSERASTPLWIRQAGNFDDEYGSPEAAKQAVHDLLGDLTDYTYAKKVTRGLYEITDDGELALAYLDDAE